MSADRLVRVVDEALVTPVRAGLLRPVGWPTGLAAIVGLGLTAYAVAVGVVVLSGPLRSTGELTASAGPDLSYPRGVLFLFLALAALALALLHTATTHLPPWARFGGLLLVVLAVLDPGVLSTQPHGVTRVVSWVAAGVLILLTLVRSRSPFAWWEFAVALAVIGGAFGLTTRSIAVESQPLGFDFLPLVVTQEMQLVGQLAIPAAVVAGLPFAQVTVSLTHRLVEAIGVRPRRLVGVVVVVLAVIRLGVTARHAGGPTATGLGWACEVGSALILLILVAAAVIATGGRRPRSLPSLAGLDEGIGRLATPVAVLVTLTVIPDLLVLTVGKELSLYAGKATNPFSDVADLLSSSAAVVTVRLGSAVALLLYAGWARRRGEAARSLLSATVAVCLLTLDARRVLGEGLRIAWTDDAVNDVASTLAILALVGFALRHRLTPIRLRALGIALGLSLVFSLRSALDAPLTLLIGVSATATLLVGLLWVTLTEGAVATRGTPLFPTSSRVLLYVGNAVLAVATLGFVAVGRHPPVGIDLSSYAVLGDTYLGTGLLLAAYVVLADTCVRSSTASEKPAASGNPAAEATRFPDAAGGPGILG